MTRECRSDWICTARSQRRWLTKYRTSQLSVSTTVPKMVNTSRPVITSRHRSIARRRSTIAGVSGASSLGIHTFSKKYAASRATSGCAWSRAVTAG